MAVRKLIVTAESLKDAIESLKDAAESLLADTESLKDAIESLLANTRTTGAVGIDYTYDEEVTHMPVSRCPLCDEEFSSPVDCNDHVHAEHC